MELWPSSPSKLTQPRWGWPLAGAFPRVARGSQPWAGGHNPFGIGIVPFRLSWFSVRRSAFDVRAFPSALSLTLPGANVTISWPANLCQTRLDTETQRNAEKRRANHLSATLCTAIVEIVRRLRRISAERSEEPRLNS